MLFRIYDSVISPTFCVFWLTSDSVIFQVDAIDLDSGENGRIGYKLSSDSQVPFAVDFESGEVIHS